MIIDPQRMWLVVGTNRGVLTQWDIRFQVPLQHWRIPGNIGEYALFYNDNRSYIMKERSFNSSQ
jgi:phosphoinositide-3-kinase regulatory subunit 4